MIKKVIYTDRTNALLNSYLREINRYKILDFSETYDLIKKAQQGDDKAREKVINANLRFVVTVAKQFQNRGIPLMDLIQAGNIGLANSIDKFNLTTGYAFLSYAIWWIKQSIFKSIYWESREIRLPMSQQVLVNSISDAIDKFLKDNNRNPSSEEISELTGIPVEQIDFLSQFSNKLVSVDDFIGGDEDNNQVCDIIPDGEPPLEDIIDKEFMKKELNLMLDSLNTREHDLIRMLFGIGLPKVSSKIVADMYGIGTERVRQLKEKALSRLRKQCKTDFKNLL
jgi:RNA polymerase primary sigma factor